MKQVIEFDEKCKQCGGTGLYVGMAEKNGAAIVCYVCKGTGCNKFKHEYEEFEERQERTGVKRVYKTNPGICIGTGNGHTLEEFGGLSYDEWMSDKPFCAGTENRKFTCPAWWYQCADYELKPAWNECLICGTFSSCRSFSSKEKCWKRFDSEQTNKSMS